MITTRMIYSFAYSKANKALLNATRDPSNDSIEALKAALEAGADINITDIRVKNELNSIGYKYTPLMWAAHNGHLNQVKFLINNGADIHLTTGRHNTALHIAAREGHTEVAKYLADIFPTLLQHKGEDKKIPQEIASTYGNYRNVTKLFKKDFSNPFFGAIKNNAIPKDIALLISSYIDDPLTLKNLSMVNKAWNELSKNKEFQSHYESSLRTYLPTHLKNKTWQQVFHYYYPSSGNPQNPLKALIEKFGQFYLIGDKIDLLVDKSTGEQIIEGIVSLPFLLSHWIDTISSKKYREIPDREIEDNIKNKLEVAQKGNTSLQVFRTLNQASLAEHKTANYASNRHSGFSKERQPVFEASVDKEVGLTLLKENADSLRIHRDSIFAIKNWRMAKDFYSTAEHAEVHEIKSFKI